MHSKRQYPKKACANPACGSIYIPHDRRQLYCSTQCRINAANDRRYIANNTRFKDEKQTRKNNKILELIWKKLEREKQKLVSKAVLELERFKKIIGKNQYSFFTFFIQGAINEGKNIYLVYNKYDQLQIIFFDSLENEKAYKENIEAIKQILQEAFVGINLKAIASEFLLKEKKRHSDLIFDFLSPVETKIIELARGKDLKEITISFNNNKPATIYVTRNEPSDQVLQKVAKYLKQGTFKRVEFRTRDGQLINYNETDIMKLK